MKATIIASTAEDRLLYNDRTEVREGGPAYFITEYLKRRNILFELVTGSKGIVYIDMRGNKEVGRVERAGKIILSADEKPELAIISTLLDEFELKAPAEFNCLDLQGYVRDADCFGRKKMFDSEELEMFDVIKATRDEARYMYPERLRRIRLLLVTDGADGFEVIQGMKKRRFSVRKLDTPDTIGAGDTFFTAFCIQYYKTRDVVKSSISAISAVEGFLREKQGGMTK